MHNLINAGVRNGSKPIDTAPSTFVSVIAIQATPNAKMIQVPIAPTARTLGKVTCFIWRIK